MIKLRKIKQKKIKQQPITLDDNYQAKNMFIIIIVIAVLLVPLYFITNLVIGKDTKSESKSTNTKEVEIQTEKILVGQLLNRNKSEYYVLADKRDNKMSTLFDNYLNDYKKKEDHLEVYKIDLDDGLNKGYIDEETNITDDLKELKLSDTTLFKIVDGKIDSYYVGNDDVVKALKEINDIH